MRKSEAGVDPMSTELQEYISTAFSWLEARAGKKNDIFFDGAAVIATSSGAVRSENQDRIALIDVQNQASNGADVKAIVLLDGIGGMAAGGSSASLALASFAIYLSFGDCTRGIKSLLLEAARFSNETVYKRYQARGGTTICAVLFGKQGAAGLSVGDSRIYLNSDEGLLQLTKDDTVSASLATSSKRLEPWRYPDSVDNRLSQFIGMGDGIEPHVITLPSYDMMTSDARLALMTDGAYFIGQEVLEILFKQKLETRELAHRVMTMAEWLGGDDNASIAIYPCHPNFADIGRNGASSCLTLTAFGETLVIFVPKNVTYAERPKSTANNSALGSTSGSPPERVRTTKIAEKVSRKSRSNISTNMPRNKRSKKTTVKKDDRQANTLVLQFIPEKE
ncbi:Serine/threonine protein phosphatase PrpC [Nitrosospira briensis]|uniref:Serine/threonine protein phosphatase PrpC n=1 Tax=Nitrosospira briensis TaxID=35799 RepID=A0A1I5B059_9PROT|nr:hypothetical protein [Nitrosospira briensis]SFN68116.1 Serine/threonine protein phosphatase PrpC [Nitrosospira briensis]